jgi:hypothetical protein
MTVKSDGLTAQDARFARLVSGRRASLEPVLTAVTFRWLLVYNRFERSMIFQASGFAEVSDFKISRQKTRKEPGLRQAEQKPSIKAGSFAFSFA